MFNDELRHLLPFAIPVLALCIPIVAIVAHQLSRASRERERHETIRQIVKAGQPIPPELLGAGEDSDWGAPRRAPLPQRLLIPGVVNLSIGLGLMGMFTAMQPDSWLWSIGLIPVCLGLGFMLLWWFERKNNPPQA